MMRGWKMARALPVAAALALALPACGSDHAEERRFTLDHLSSEEAIALIQPYEAARVSMDPNDDGRVLSVGAPADDMAEIAGLLSRHDVPRQVRLRFQLVEANGFTNVDPAIAEVEAALRELFRFSGYRLVTEAMMTATQHSDASQKLLGFDGAPLYLLTSVGKINVTGDPRSVELRVTLGDRGEEVLRTSVIVPDGQTVVLGTARPFQDRGALILVVSPGIQ
jgi:hypothetical protein